ncbi:MAG: hypothetical protein CMF74_06020 [Maricaulis sp.]|nr:hypothetical protein [Maricaulis sp.]
MGWRRSRAGEALFEPAIAAAFGFGAEILLAIVRATKVFKPRQENTPFVIDAGIEECGIADFVSPKTLPSFPIETGVEIDDTARIPVKQFHNSYAIPAPPVLRKSRNPIQMAISPFENAAANFEKFDVDHLPGEDHRARSELVRNRLANSVA